MKFLSMSFREAMSDFFGKAGMPWHGVMFVRKPREAESVATGEFVVSYVDAMMADKKEDGFATLSAIYLALKQYKQECPWIDHCAVMTDGAGAYSGVVTTVGLSMLKELTEVEITDAFTGVSGKGKSQLDGHFATKGGKTRRLVAAGLHDIITPTTLYEGVARTASSNETAMLYQPDRSSGSALDTKSIKQLAAMSHRKYEYNGPDGTFSGVRLRQQTNLGDGLFIPAAELRKQDAAPFAAPTLLGSQSGAANATTTAAPTPAPAPTPNAAPGPRRNQNRPRQQPLPIARAKEGREYQEGIVAQRRAKRQTAKEQKEAAERAADITRCSQSLAFWCRCDAQGDARCNRVFQTARGLERHIRSGKHTEGVIKPFKSGVAVDRGTAQDRDISLVQNALMSVTTQRDGSDKRALELQPADGFNLRLADGDLYEQDPAAMGWARAQRLPVVRSTVAQLEFIYNTYTLGEVFDQVKLSPADARQVMADLGTAKVATRFKGHPYFGVDEGKPRFKRTEILDEPKIKTYFGQGKSALKKKLDNAQRRGAVNDDSDGSPSEAEGEEGETSRRRKKRRKGRPGPADKLDLLVAARSKLSAHGYDLRQAMEGTTRQHLNARELKALLADASKAVGGKKDAVVARAREHETLIVTRAQAAATTADDAAGAAGMDLADATAAGAVAAHAAGAAFASVQDRTFLTANLRTSHFPKGLSMPQSKAAKLAAVWSTCGELADATDSLLRSTFTNGRLPSIGLAWLRREHDALAHLHLDAINAAAVNAAERREAESGADLVGMDLEQAGPSKDAEELADERGESASDRSASNRESESDRESTDSESESELGSTVGTNADHSSSTDTDGEGSDQE